MDLALFVYAVIAPRDRVLYYCDVLSYCRAGVHSITKMKKIRIIPTCNICNILILLCVYKRNTSRFHKQSLFELRHITRYDHLMNNLLVRRYTGNHHPANSHLLTFVYIYIYIYTYIGTIRVCVLYYNSPRNGLNKAFAFFRYICNFFSRKITLPNRNKKTRLAVQHTYII